MVSQSKTTCAVPFVVSTRYTRPSNMPAVKARPSGSLGISLTSMVPIALGITIVRTIDRLCKIPHADASAQQRIAGDDVQRAGGHHEVGGHHQVEIRTGRDAVRVEIVLRRIVGPFAHHPQVCVELGDATGRAAGVVAHLGDQESAVFQRQEVVGDVGERAAGREQELRMARLRDIEEEDAVLPAQQREQAAARQDVLVGRRDGSGAARSRRCPALGPERS